MVVADMIFIRALLIAACPLSSRENPHTFRSSLVSVVSILVIFVGNSTPSLFILFFVGDVMRVC